MYKDFKLSKRAIISFETFNKQKELLCAVFKKGFHKWRDEYNCITFYSIVFPFRFRICLDVQDKHPIGHSN